MDAIFHARFMHLLSRLQRHLGLRVHPTGNLTALSSGDIFLFNHFTRFETLIPPYLLYRHAGAFARVVAHHGLFNVHPLLTQILLRGGAVPNNMPGLLPFLTAEILRGRKVVIFPEGGMIKDKHVVDGHGHVSIWSDKAGSYRKHHRGAAALAVMTELARAHLRQLIDAHDEETLARWAYDLNLMPDDLRRQAALATTLVPGNITFYPVRLGGNALTDSLKHLTPLSTRSLDELVVESNLLFKKTDMDVHLGTPLPVQAPTPAAARQLHQALTHDVAGLRPLPDLYQLREHAAPEGAEPVAVPPARRHLVRWLEHETERLRDVTATHIYAETTLNLNHLIAVAIVRFMAQHRTQVPVTVFHRVLYRALKQAQQQPGLNLHCSLAWPEFYAGLLSDHLADAPAGFRGFMRTAARLRLVRLPSPRHTSYRFSHALQDELEDYETRLFNPVRTHANEAAPVAAFRQLIDAAIADDAAQDDTARERQLAAWLWDDEQRALAWARGRYPVRHSQPPAAAGQPVRLPGQGAAARTGILLVHGFTSTPAQMRGVADFLHQHGHTVLVMRLPGHGTSPADLATRSRADWHRAVATNYRILAAETDRVIILGFSMGGALALHHAAGRPAKLAGVLSLALPMQIGMRIALLLPLVEALNALVAKLAFWHPRLRHGWLREYDNAATEQPECNYTRMPVRAISQLTRLVRGLRARLTQVAAPVLLVQGDADDTATPAGVLRLHQALGAARREIYWLPGGAHGLLARNNPRLWQRILRFVREVAPEASA